VKRKTSAPHCKLDPAEAPEFDRLWSEQAPEVTNVVNSFEEQGRIKGVREFVCKQLEKKFGTLPQVAVE
jgi:hypothetical protein